MVKKQPIPTQTQYRDSRTGQFTDENYAKRNPKETEKERIKHPERKK